MSRYYLDHTRPGEFDQEEFEIRMSLNPEESHRARAGFFVFDTGSPISIIGTEFARRLDLPLSKFSYDDGQGWIAGAKVELHRLDPCTFGMKGFKGNAMSGRFAFHVPDYDGIPGREVENILGMDFPIGQGLDFVLENDEDDGPEAYFED